LVKRSKIAYAILAISMGIFFFVAGHLILIFQQSKKPYDQSLKI